jgi:threonylcarbamoyladenosine tRNA methylthiotransferase MtaB
MVGFPGETDDEFSTTKEFLMSIPFLKMHIFKYSPRKGTKAALFENQVNGDKKDERSKELHLLSDEMSINYLKKFQGRKMPVLFEQPVKDVCGFYEGLTPNYIRVMASGTKECVGNIENVLLSDASTHYIKGNIIIEDI